MGASDNENWSLDELEEAPAAAVQAGLVALAMVAASRAASSQAPAGLILWLLCFTIRATPVVSTTARLPTMNADSTCSIDEPRVRGVLDACTRIRRSKPQRCSASR